MVVASGRGAGVVVVEQAGRVRRGRKSFSRQGGRRGPESHPRMSPPPTVGPPRRERQEALDSPPAPRSRRAPPEPRRAPAGFNAGAGAAYSSPSRAFRYLNYDNRYADLLFEVVTRRYLNLPVLITTNKPFSEWAEVFSSAACVVTLVDRLIHRSEIVQLDGESYRLREAKEQAAKRSKVRSRRTAQSHPSRGTRS